MKTCFFMGHHDAPDGLLSVLTEEVNRQIETYHVEQFVVGNYGNFDRLAARAVIDAKKYHPNVMLTLLLPYHPTERPVVLPTGFDNSYYPVGMEYVPRRAAIVRANRFLTDHCDVLIIYVRYAASNTEALLKYAERREKRGELRMIRI